MVVALWHFENPTNPWYSLSSNLGNKDREFGFFSWRASLQTVELPGKISGSAIPLELNQRPSKLGLRMSICRRWSSFIEQHRHSKQYSMRFNRETINVVWALIYSQSWLVRMKCEWKWKLHSLETNQEETIEKITLNKAPHLSSGSISASNRRKISSRGHTPQNG